MKYNRDEIVKALDCCSTNYQQCDKCPYQNNCDFQLEADAAALIRELTTDNEKLQDLFKEAQQYNEAWVADNGKLRQEIKTIKEDTVQKMTEMLKRRLPIISPSVFDHVARAVLEENK